MGGKACAANRRKRKQVTAYIKDLLRERAEPSGVLDLLKKKGLDPGDETTNAAALAYSILYEAVGGNINAARLLLEMNGEDPQLEQRKANDRARLKLQKAALDASGPPDNTINIHIVPAARRVDAGDNEQEEPQQ